MIALADDPAPAARFSQTLKMLWFIGAATALPLIDFARSSSRLSLAGALVGSLFLLTLVAAHLYIMRAGPSLLAYEERFRELVVHTALKQVRIPVRSIKSVRLFGGQTLRYRHGVSVRGYHVGGFVAPGIGQVRVAASSLAGEGLLVEYTSRTPFMVRRRCLYISPDEPDAVKLVLEDLIAEHHWRVALGQP